MQNTHFKFGEKKNVFPLQTAIPEFRLELWPGYITSIRQHEEDILVCVEIAHKVMRTETIYDIMNRVRREERDFKTAIMERILGGTVLTAYNNNTYRIDDIDFEKSPSSTFETKNGPISFIEYYKSVSFDWHIIRSAPPLAIFSSNFVVTALQYRHQGCQTAIDCVEIKRTWSSWRQRRNDSLGAGIVSRHRHHRRHAQKLQVSCNAFIIPIEMKFTVFAFRTMKAMAEHTKMGPPARIQKLLMFSKRIEETQRAKPVLSDWNLKLDTELVTLKGRLLPFENIVFGNDRK